MNKGEHGARSNLVIETETSGLGEINPKFFVFRSLVDSEEDQKGLVEEALFCHSQNQGGSQDVMREMQLSSTSQTSLKLNLGIPCGGALTNILPKSVAVARQALHIASRQVPAASSKSLHMLAHGPLSGLSLLYGVDASMPSHYDSPTQPGQREEWLAMITLGNSVAFRCNNEILILHSGDVLVMDSMAVLHGVERIVADDNENPICSRIGMPFLQARLGILLWQGKEMQNSIPSTRSHDGIDVFGIDCLFDAEAIVN